ncbi:MAG: SIMPL domain-containing protein [Desulfobacterales bacterium]|jgi:uncharacterized protein YggE
MRKIFMLLPAIFWFGFQPCAYAQSNPAENSTVASLTVRGSGEVSAAPDQAIVQLGAVFQGERAAEAQEQVNRVVSAILKAVKAVGIPGENISTTELTLVPVQERAKRTSVQQTNLPRIVGYLATNVVRIEINDMNKIGDVIDAGIGAGANRLEGLSFQLKDDAVLRQKALRQAVLNAREKADSIADALNLRLGRILEITEEGVQAVRPQLRVQRMAVAAAESTPVEPSRIQVSAAVIVGYQIENSAMPAAK